MKNYINKTLLAIGLAAGLSSCSDFEEINEDPFAANEEQVQVAYFLNNAITGAQQNPHVAERAFVLYWKAASRQDRTNTLPVGSASDGWSNDYFNAVSGWLNHVNTGIDIAHKQIEEGNIKEYSENVLQISRIWRVYLMSEMSDNFGPIPIEAFQEVNPEFASTKDVYYYMLAELKDATAKLDTELSEKPDDGLDPAFGFDYDKWNKYANSMRMRLAMRLSEVDPSMAQKEFEEAASNEFILNMDEAFAVQEKGGWDDFTAPMSRQWNAQYLSATLNDLFIGLGGIESTSVLGESFAPYVKDKDYAGLLYDEHFATKTNAPKAGFWFDGLYKEIDPRAYKAFGIPGDFDDSEFTFYPTWTSDARNTKRPLVDDAGEVLDSIDASFTWNASVPGSWGKKGAKNFLYSYIGTIPRMKLPFRDGSKKRIFFAPWESYFLVAEAAEKGWNTPMDGKTAYEEGIKANFVYWGLSSMVNEYLSSEEYNNAGTSVSWDHTSEPPQTHKMRYKNGYTGAESTVDIKYPNNHLYKDGQVKNDHLTKIITQKYIAHFPYLPLEAWSDHRRLGLPFFPNPAVENPLPDHPNLNQSNYMEVHQDFFPQRLKYPSGLRNSDSEGYQQAVNFLNGGDDVFTPLWWAQSE
ncbi:SusD/RagB family nutrient-binding outer membrane lipoprotein [Salegentibacter maritimus]|uniref:SusD/RagB family nutrient-binding outer membrane lipoprotein n=1 Tax=Salegentibacter maritimus TaxID=2794347 RepID=UPI0018E414ED|nr:SusD/RagB family nutrient-binding outer membrane lipoprotein [Salegentibacter maritimus]MBI6117580.1 SusD/RagB family nutrient-binding outer membrane lipoprotein [Salegentibacter maritimus]